MTFGKLMRAIAGGSDKYYMTTQPLAEDETGPLALHAAPVTQLQEDFPARPRLLGNLVPHQYNLWVGNSPDGTSSGLHHDFHDNLYVLCRGRKRFSLFAPSEHAALALTGKVHRVHANGLINFDGLETREDGAHPTTLAEDRVARAEARLAEDDSEAARDELEAAEDALDELVGFNFGDEDEDEDEDDGSAGQGRASKRRRTEDKAKDAPLPDNFCKTSEVDGKAAVRVDVDVRAGEMLFLPASWFHEVTSFSSAGGHIAFNYWMHPARHGAPFDAPYEDDFWARRYAQLSKAGAGAAKSAAQPAAVADKSVSDADYFASVLP